MPIVFIALVIKFELFMLQLTCEKDVGMGLCMFNFVILLSLHLVSVLFGSSIPTSLDIFLNVFFWYCTKKKYCCTTLVCPFFSYKITYIY